MPRAMENVRNADGSAGCCRLDSGEEWSVVHNGIRQKALIDPAAAKIQRRSVIQSAARAHGGEPKIVLTIPESMDRRSRAADCRRSLFFWLLGPLWRSSRVPNLLLGVRRGAGFLILRRQLRAKRLDHRHKENRSQKGAPNSDPRSKTHYVCPTRRPPFSTGSHRLVPKTETKILDEPPEVVKQELVSWESAERGFATLTQVIVAFLLTPQEGSAQNRRNFCVSFRLGRSGSAALNPSGG